MIGIPVTFEKVVPEKKLADELKAITKHSRAARRKHEANDYIEEAVGDMKYSASEGYDRSTFNFGASEAWLADMVLSIMQNDARFEGMKVVGRVNEKGHTTITVSWE